MENRLYFDTPLFTPPRRGAKAMRLAVSIAGAAAITAAFWFIPAFILSLYYA